MELYKPLGYLLGRSLKVFKNQLVFEFKEKQIELTFEQFVILHMLNSNCGLIQQDLANQMQKDKSIIVRQINALLEGQYVISKTNKEDKRKKNLILSQKGIEILTQMKEISSEVSNKLLLGISENELEIFRIVLSKIQANGGFKEEDFNC